MKTSEFNKVYAYAKTVDIVNDSYFLVAGYLWISMTQNQINKMFDLCVEQGNVVIDGKWIELANGIRICRA
ncbi:MAG: hypothetical protein RRY19_11420 [Clostridium sp.]